jgi:hypothetical protein
MLDRDIDPEFYREERFLLFCLLALVAGIIWIFRKQKRKAILLGVVLLLFGLMNIPSIPMARGHAQRAACINNLRAIQEAKIRWANNHHKEKTDLPVDSDLFGEGLYLKQKPVCPAGGTYILGAAGELPKCSLSERGHTLGSKE